MNKWPATGTGSFGGIFTAARVARAPALAGTAVAGNGPASATGRLHRGLFGRWDVRRCADRLSGAFRVLACLLHSLRDRSDWPDRPRRRRVAAAKYLARTLSMPRQHARYLHFIEGSRRMDAYRRRDPRLLERHFHRYMHAQWSRPARLRSLRQHYDFALAVLPGPLFEAVYLYGNANLGSLTLKDGSQLKLCLQPPIFLGCEGELCLQLSDASDRALYRIVFSVIGDEPTVAIGCLQGPEGAQAKDNVRELTRNMHGMRPKQLMLSLVYAFARYHGIEQMLAVSNDAHPLRRSRRVFQADYDAFWQEQKGHDAGNGWFVLPGMPLRKTEADVASNHRSAFRRREAMRLEAERLLTEALRFFPAPAVKAAPAYALESPPSSASDRLEASWIP